MAVLDRPKTHPEINKFRRESLVAATLRVVAAEGIENTTVAKICEAAGVSRGLANHYFQSKEELLLIAFQKLLDDLGDVTRRASQEQESPTRKLFAIIHAIFRNEFFNSTARAAYLCFWTASLSNQQFARINRANYARYHSSVARLFEKAAKQRDIDINAKGAAIGLIGMIDGLWLDLSIGVDDFSPDDAVAACRDYIVQKLSISMDDPDMARQVSRPAARTAKAKTK
jgi:TetR/AcrR family transcriptional regulator, transcriptional repressor of bet genes